MTTLIKSDLDFILQQIIIAERNAAGAPLLDPLLPFDPLNPLSSLIEDPLLSFGLRTVDGTFNNLLVGQQNFGAADQVFPRLLPPDFRQAGTYTIDLDGPGGQTVLDATSYQQTKGWVFDPQPRLASNLVVDQTSNNPAATAAAGRNGQLRDRPNPLAPRDTDPLLPAERRARHRPVRAVQLLVHAVRPVLRPWPRPDQQGRQRHRLRAAGSGRPAAHARSERHPGGRRRFPRARRSCC